MEIELLKKICHQLNLGTMNTQPIPLKGGFMHKMYSLITTEGRYAVKLLNPYVMKRDTAMSNYHIAEKLEIALEQHGIPILPALIYGGRKMQEIDGQFFYLYEWYDGKALKGGEIKEIHCCEIGKLLAHIHGIDRREIQYERNEIRIDWDFYIEQLALHNTELHSLLAQSRSVLYESQEYGNAAIKRIPAVVSICHNDMDSKNVLWNGNDCRIIDLECLSYSSPFIELYEMALCWSGYEKCNIDFSLFGTLIRSYAEVGGQLLTDWKTLYDSNYGRLEWLEYNVKRALGIDCSEDEKKIGISEVRDTIAHVVYYHEAKHSILNCLNQLQLETVIYKDNDFSDEALEPSPFGGQSLGF